VTAASRCLARKFPANSLSFRFYGPLHSGKYFLNAGLEAGSVRSTAIDSLIGVAKPQASTSLRKMHPKNITNVLCVNKHIV
jgi:hypothetical protein